MDKAEDGTRKEFDRIANEIRTRIFKGHLRPGDKLLSEKDLIDHFGVSRPTVREALRVLEFEELIVVFRGGGGARVCRPSMASLARQMGGYLQRQGANLEDIFEARLEIEPNAAALLAARASRESIEAMEENIAAGYKAIGDYPAFNRTILAFSRLILEHCGNKTLLLAGGMIQDVIQSQIYFVDTTLIYDAAKNAREREHQHLDACKALVAAVRERDSIAAAQIRRRQIMTSRDMVLSAYRLQMPIEVSQSPRGEPIGDLSIKGDKSPPSRRRGQLRSPTG